MKQEWVVGLLSLVCLYAGNLFSGENHRDSLAKKRAVLAMVPGGLSRFDNELRHSAGKLSCSAESLRRSTEAKRRNVESWDLKSSTEKMQDAIIKQDYACFPHSNYMSDIMTNIASGEDKKKNFTDSFYNL